MFQIMGLFRRLVYLIIVVISIVYNFFFLLLWLYINQPVVLFFQNVATGCVYPDFYPNNRSASSLFYPAKQLKSYFLLSIYLL